MKVAGMKTCLEVFWVRLLPVLLELGPGAAGVITVPGKKDATYLGRLAKLNTKNVMLRTVRL